MFGSGAPYSNEADFKLKTNEDGWHGGGAIWTNSNGDGTRNTQCHTKINNPELWIDHGGSKLCKDGPAKNFCGKPCYDLCYTGPATTPGRARS